MPGISPAAAEEYIASLFANVLKRDPEPDEFAHWVTTATALPPEQVYFAFVKSKEYKLQQQKSVPTMFSARSLLFTHRRSIDHRRIRRKAVPPGTWRHQRHPFR